MLEAGVLDKVFLALSREPGIEKVKYIHVCSLLSKKITRKKKFVKVEHF